MNFGENLKNFRKNSKMSQEVLAEKVGVSRQAVSRWEVGEAYPEMSNIVALCSIFHCNINDLINDNIVDIESFDKETQDSIVKFKKEQQKRMKGLSKAIYIITNIVKTIIAIPTVCMILLCLIFPFVSNTFEINNNKIKIINKEIDYRINGNIINIDGTDHYVEHYVETRTNIDEFIKSHDNTFYRISIEYILICMTILSILTVLSLHCLYKLYKNIYNGNTPFTIENEKIVHKACLFVLVEMVLQKITALIYSIIAHFDLAIDINIKDIIVILIGISIIYIFKYGRMIQADTKAKIYD